MVPVTAMPVSVIGYPFGLSAGANWPIWKTGNIASDHGIDFEVNRPAFLMMPRLVLACLALRLFFGLIVIKHRMAILQWQVVFRLVFLASMLAGFMVNQKLVEFGVHL
ncbi:hypothetical protein [Vibrio sp. 624788]|uniref:hypothetical protein n=1 Tax=Vibrio sp. 624788 TaxID=1234362 RepID=UPI00036FD18C|nr:hypothetical protein [Vibrio sp. 624788]